ncbi:DNA N-6-adenine-methyltransferase [Erwinia typographi]|uniref:DNA N-6-adenine-methyltransferase n=1 Tax=Erwinia typographi TaxID=371042 RepID=UPI0009FE2899
MADPLYLSQSIRRYDSQGKHKGGSDLWQTPRRLFNNLNREFDFTIDAAASADNALCERYWDERDDALQMDWSQEYSVFCNPPYSLVSKFLALAHLPEQSVFVVPARVHTGYWLRHVWSNAYCHEIRFLHRGVRFSPAPGVIQAIVGNRGAAAIAVLVFRNVPRKHEHRITICCADTLLPLQIVSRGGRAGRPTLYDAGQIDRVVQLSESGSTISEIAQTMSIPRSSVGRIVQRL